MYVIKIAVAITSVAVAITTIADAITTIATAFLEQKVEILKKIAGLWHGQAVFPKNRRFKR
jgi:ABC-type uncharacterized transport system permease subunit